MIADFFPLLGISLLLIAGVLQLSRLFGSYRYTQLIALVLALTLSFLSFDGAFILYHLHAYFSELSIVTMSLLSLFIYHQFFQKKCYHESSFKWLMITTLFISILFYPMALGLTQFDPYTLGYSSIYMWLFTLALCLLALYFHYYLIVIVILLANLAFCFSLNSSLNHWDYLLDPLLAFYSLYWVIKHYALRIAP